MSLNVFLPVRISRNRVTVLGACLLMALLTGCNDQQRAPTMPPQAAPLSVQPPAMPEPQASRDIVDWFNDYYEFAAADIEAHRERYLPVVANALGVKASAKSVLGDPEVARIEALDHKVGYLAIGGANDDSELTMAAYTAVDGRQVLVVDSTICVDDCDMHVEVFGHDASGRLALLPADALFPSLTASELVTPGEVLPKRFRHLTPMLRYRPLPNGRDIEVSTWFGAQAEDDHNRWEPDDAGAMGTLALRWDAASGRFVRP